MQRLFGLLPQPALSNLLFSSFFLCVIAGCSSHLTMTLKGSEDLNNGGNSVVVRLYLLRNEVSFQRATIESFWQDDYKLLGEDLLDRIQITLHPGQTERREIDIPQETNFIGVAADFYKPDRDSWREVYSIASNKEKKVWISVGMDKLSFD
jgi:type VI secretion system VasD/TssJ family lipoprotein